MKAAVLANQNDAKLQEKGKSETIKLCNRDPAVVNIEAIYQLQDTLRNLKLDQEHGSKIWERAVAARPTDQGLLTSWLNGLVSESDWLNAQKV